MKNTEFTRRAFLKSGVATSAALAAAPSLLNGALAQEADLAPYKAAKIDWQQFKGETITVAVIPATYFDNLITLAPQFEALTGITVRFEKIPPAQIRQKSVIDLTSKTATYATHAADPMYYALYAANKWVEPLDPFLKDASLTDPAWFKADDIVPHAGHGVPPELLDVALEFGAERTVIPKAINAAINLGGLKDEAPSLAQRNDLFHQHVFFRFSHRVRECSR